MSHHEAFHTADPANRLSALDATNLAIDRGDQVGALAAAAKVIGIAPLGLNELPQGVVFVPVSPKITHEDHGAAGSQTYPRTVQDALYVSQATLRWAKEVVAESVEESHVTQARSSAERVGTIVVTNNIVSVVGEAGEQRFFADDPVEFTRYLEGLGYSFAGDVSPLKQAEQQLLNATADVVAPEPDQVNLSLYYGLPPVAPELQPTQIFPVTEAPTAESMHAMPLPETQRFAPIKPIRRERAPSFPSTDPDAVAPTVELQLPQETIHAAPESQGAPSPFSRKEQLSLLTQALRFCIDGWYPSGPRSDPEVQKARAWAYTDLSSDSLEVDLRPELTALNEIASHNLKPGLTSSGPMIFGDAARLARRALEIVRSSVEDPDRERGLPYAAKLLLEGGLTILGE